MLHLDSTFIPIAFPGYKIGLFITVEVGTHIGTGHDFLHEKELHYAAGMQEKRRRSFCLGRYAAKGAITNVFHGISFTELRIDQGALGFPVIVHPAILNTQVSITHTDSSAAAICFPEYFPMGVDLEEINVQNTSIIETELTMGEKELFKHTNCSYNCFCSTLWTAKEALAKALKTGFSIPFHFLEIKSLIIENDFVLCYFSHFSQFVGLSVNAGSNRLTIVFPAEVEKYIRNYLGNISSTCFQL
jgi:phosphopantetheinyl transferase (holo-ACP synthase)